ncbi:stage v sporulation protein k [Chrysochromulina tobinii]|uniref:Stage v sporulation protein k n=1 Tax=Chrysochromulina tobinii TaxID=1460289 RepID=A0A0M0K8J0_9EUKA|nr:stage v sporulation protein k [Chrysochromulina tobinii]|eukprot:KOO35114.1 stage v sporulation protein k [Chrysochromulina sp. CCMP291]
MLEEVDGGVLFIDEVYQLDPKNNKDGADIMNLLHTFAEDKRGERSVVLAGYRDEVETLLSFNPGLASRSPNTWVFEDYLEPELRSIYHKMMSDRKMVVESASSFGVNATT